MEYRVLYGSSVSVRISFFIFLWIYGCAPLENVADDSANQVTSPQTPVEQEQVNSEISTKEANPGVITVTYQNQSSSIQIMLDPNKDEFYLDLSGMIPQEKDSIIVSDSSLIKNRATDIQTLLTSYRKAQDLFYLGEYRQALEEVDKTLYIQETADAYALKGTIFFMLENITAARANWNRAVQMNPNIPVPSIPELEVLIDEIKDGDQ